MDTDRIKGNFLELIFVKMQLRSQMRDVQFIQRNAC